MNTLLNSASLYHTKALLSASPSACASPTTSSWTPLPLSIGRGIFRRQQTNKIAAQVGTLKLKVRGRSSSRNRTPAVLCVIPAADRVVATLAYALPFFNGLQYGRYLFMQYPAAAVIFQPLFPLLDAYQSIPYASFVAFFGLYLGVVRNPSFSRYVRFNAMQAVVVDVLLALPMIFQRILSPGRGPIFSLFLLIYNAIFLCIVFGFFYALYCCILGTTPKIPFVADAADAQL